MPCSLKEVIKGLGEGHVYRHALGNERGTETGYMTVTPVCPDEFRHDVAGHNEYGGWGGSADLPIDFLQDGKWEADGWELIR